jgi:ribose 5-phosphate isomerase RpiB
MFREAGHRVTDFGDDRLKPEHDSLDFANPLVRATGCGEVTPGVAICSSGTKRHRRRLAKVAALEGKSAKAA